MNVSTEPPILTVGELLRRLGDIPPDRVRFKPAPGTATVADLARSENKGCELVEGTLVEKAMGWSESNLGGWILTLLNNFIIPRNLGKASGEQGMVELPGGPVRGPDVTYVSWDRLTGRTGPTDPVPELAPDLVVEVLSRGNTPGEMARKRGEYFTAGVSLVWEVDPRARTVRVYTAEDIFTDLTEADTLDGGIVLPGFTLPLAQLFAELDRHG